MTKHDDVRMEHKEDGTKYIMDNELYEFFETVFDRVPTFNELSRHWPSQYVVAEYGAVAVRFAMAVTYQCGACDDAKTYGGSMPKEDLRAHAEGDCVMSNAGEMERLRRNFNAALRNTYRLRNAWNECRDENVLPLD